MSGIRQCVLDAYDGISPPRGCSNVASTGVTGNHSIGSVDDVSQQHRSAIEAGSRFRQNIQMPVPDDCRRNADRQPQSGSIRRFHLSLLDSIVSDDEAELFQRDSGAQ